MFKGKATETECNFSIIRNLAKEFEEPTQMNILLLVRGGPFNGDTDDCQRIGKAIDIIVQSFLAYNELFS